MLLKRPSPVRNYLRRILQAVALAGTIAVGIIALALIASQTQWFKDWLRRFAVREANQYVNGTVSIGSLGGDLFYGIQLGDVAIDVNGERIVTLKRLEVKYSISQLISNGITVRQIRLEQPFVLLRRDASGWNVSKLVRRQQQEANRTGPSKSVTLPAIEIDDGRVQIDDRAPSATYTLPRQITGLNVKGAFAYEPVHYSVTLNQLSLQASNPSLTAKNLTGRLGVRSDDLHVEKLTLQTPDTTATIDGVIHNYLGDPDVQVTFSAPRLSLPEFAGLLPSLGGYQLHPVIDVKAEGKQSSMQLAVNGKSEAGVVSGRLTANLLAPDYRVRGDLSLQNLNLAPILKDPSQKSDITGFATVDLQLASAPATGPASAHASTRRPPPVMDRLRGRVVLDAPSATAFGYRASNVKVAADLKGRHIALDGRAAAYGATATTRGTLDVPAASGQPVQFDLAGTASHVSLAALPPRLNVPRVVSNVNAQSYHVKGQTGRTTSVDATATLDASTITGAAFAAGTTGQVSLTSSGQRLQTLSYAASGSTTDLNLATVGRAFQVAALDNPAYGSRINGQFDVSASGTTVDQMKVDAAGTLTGSEFYGGTIPKLAFDAHLADDDLRWRANGSFQGFDPARITGDQRYAGHVNGTVNASFELAKISAPLTPDSIAADGAVTLTQSDVAGTRIDSADVDGQYANRRGTLRQATVKGPGIEVSGSGPIALDQAGQTDAKLHAVVTNLADIGKIVNQPISGTATIDGTVTGNADVLKASGALSASDLAYNQNNALALTSQFDVTMPNLDVAQARVHAQSAGTFIDAGGLHINSMTATTTYEKQKLDFQTHVAMDPEGTDAAGSILYHPDHQEIHLLSLAVGMQGIRWQTAPGSSAAIQYGSNRVQFKDVHLVNGDQSLAVDGAFPLDDAPTAEGITVQARNVDISQIDRLAMQNRGLTGTLNADAKIAGTSKAPDVTGHVDIQNGGFRQFKYQSFSVDGGYRDQVSRIDARLVQSPGVELTATGTVPVTAFQPNPPGMSGHIEPSGTDRVDLHIQSSSIGLGMVQGLTEQVTNVTGTAQADVTIGGSGRDPHATGYVAIDNGGFTVPVSGTSYKGLTTKIVLEEERIHVPRLTITDAHGSPMTVEGDLAVHATEVGAVNIAVEAHDFNVINNDLGKIAMDANLHLTGDVHSPRIQGDIRTSASRLELDKVLLLFSGPYATEALPDVVSAEDTAKSDKGAQQATREALSQGPASNAARGSAQAVPMPGTPVPITLPGTPAAAAPVPGTPVAITLPGRRAPVAPLPGTPVETAQTGGLMAPLAMNVHFIAPDNFIVRGDNLRPGATAARIGNINLTVGADLYIRKRPNGPITLLGTADTVRGFYEFQGRRFTVRRDGTLRFDGLPEINPTVNISADRLIPNTGVTTTVNVTGTAFRPHLELTSDPPLDQSDILSLIVFNQDVNDLGTGQRASLAETAAGIASGFVASSLGKEIGKALDVDLFQITTSDPDTGESAGGVTLGKQVTDKAFVQFQQQFGDRSFTSFMLNYQLSKFLRANVDAAPETSGVANRLTERRIERAGVDLIFFFSY